MYAANVVDLTVHTQNPVDTIPMVILRHVLDNDPAHIVECERGKAVGMGHGSLFVCSAEQAFAIIQVIRRKYEKYQWRFYEKAKRGWKRI